MGNAQNQERTGIHYYPGNDNSLIAKQCPLDSSEMLQRNL
jgi:hypothetical protein